ncbi:hypothetical protein [Nostoc sp.]
MIVDETVAEAIASGKTDIIRMRSPLVTVMSCMVMMALVTPHSQTTKGH